MSLDPSLCRLCHGPLVPTFSIQVLSKYQVQYFKCEECFSLQTERPYWLAEAYSDSNLADTDTGAARRTLKNLSATFAIAKLLGASNLIDFGGGDGLLCRFLRDSGLNCFVNDKFGKPTYAGSFTRPDFSHPDLVTAFEVLEHLPDPSIDLEEIFGRKPFAVLVSTEIFATQEKDWWYLSPETGQHIFFYSERALELVAHKYKYEVYRSDSFILFIRNISGIRKILIKTVMNKYLVHLLKVIPVLGLGRGATRDMEALKKSLEQEPR